jgi:hypothetical protein
MRGDQLAPHWWVVRAIEASPNGLIVAEIAGSDGAQGTAREKSLSKAYSNNWDGPFSLGGPEANSLSDTFLNGRA